MMGPSQGAEEDLSSRGQGQAREPRHGVEETFPAPPRRVLSRWTGTFEKTGHRLGFPGTESHGSHNGGLLQRNT